MDRQIYRYCFRPEVSVDEIRATLKIAAVATESVFGRRRVLLEADFDLASEEHSCWIDATNDVGRHLHQVFRGYVSREFEPGAFTVTKVGLAPARDALLMAT